MNNPMTGENLVVREIILTYGLGNWEQKLLNFMLGSIYDVVDSSDNFSYLLAINAIAIFLNPSLLNNDQISEFNAMYKDQFSIMIIFTGKPNFVSEFKYHIVKITYKTELELKLVYNHLIKRARHGEWKLNEIFAGEIILVDIEVSGTNRYTDEIIQIDAVYINDGKVLDKNRWMIKPDKKLNFEIEKLSGITNAELELEDNVKIIIPQIESWHNGIAWCVFNEDFDYPFLDRAYWNADLVLEKKIYDLQKIVMDVFPNIMKSRISEICNEIGKNDILGIEAMLYLYQVIYKDRFESL